MKLEKLKTPSVNQNGYHKNLLTKERIGTLFIYPIDYTPDDCLACDGYLLKINDFEDLHRIIGNKFNQADDPTDSFRIPDYNVTGKFLQPGANVGNQIEAGLPAITHTHTATTSSAGGHTHTRGSMEISGSFYQSNWKQKYSSGTQGTVSGCFTRNNDGGTGGNNWGANGGECYFTASKNWTGSTSNNGAHTHTLTTANNSSINALFGASNTVQPSSQIVHICIKYK